ncbi:carboxypeptidase regulatory-like domain-containing protein [Leptolyngbya sp. FACHB-321]|uniref:carboxypeptidase-like regulatory domain-containing protein n=1 Tax=Leptolyngbya sp. FACHB-321 TaxID=2692807 RepID=UPI001685004B|nr:carboxypeptidase-like regulatory domain-containing protein [Leptolyngbya sp. FACHB-321]MBD2037651.1 carboxypeptidase regulatory-like domain-containing protein [Leptolyngbya sp. FACHB-321]
MPTLFIEEIHHYVAIAGSVANAVSGGAIAGTLVEIVDLKRRTLTREDGSFYFTDLPVGSYILTIAAPHLSSRYGAINGLTIQVQNNERGKPILDPKAKVQLVPTTLTGQVVRADTSKPIRGAIVQLRRGDLQTITDKEGRYTLSGLLASKPSIQVTAKDFSTSVQTVVLTTGQTTTANFSLSATS